MTDGLNDKIKDEFGGYRLDPDHPVDREKDEGDARPLGGIEKPPETKDDRALVLIEDLDAREEPERDHRDHEDER